MSIQSRSRGIRIVREGDSTRVLDVHCGHCAACRAALDFWCLDALEDGEELFVLARPVDADQLHRWLGALAALATTTPSPDSVLLVMEDVDAGAVTELVRPWQAGPVVVSTDGRDDETRTRLATLSPTGRAQTVLALHDGRTAVRSVERGGQVCLPDLDVAGPSVTELVQRDVKLVSAASTRDLVAATSWADLASRLEQVLDTDPSPLLETPHA